jgi:hypothetical protein
LSDGIDCRGSARDRVSFELEVSDSTDDLQGTNEAYSIFHVHEKLITSHRIASKSFLSILHYLTLFILPRHFELFDFVQQCLGFPGCEVHPDGL